MEFDDPVILADAAECKKLKQFLQAVNPKIKFLPADSIPDGIKGAVAIFQPEATPQGQTEMSMWFGWRFAKPANSVVNVEADKVAETLGQCLDDRNWIPADDIKSSLIGFANHQQSKWLRFNVVDVKAAVQADPALDAKMKAYASSRDSLKGKSQKA